MITELGIDGYLQSFGTAVSQEICQNGRAEQCCKNLKYEIWVPLLDDFYLSDAQFPQLILGSLFSYCEVSQKCNNSLFIPDFLK